MTSYTKITVVKLMIMSEKSADFVVGIFLDIILISIGKHFISILKDIATIVKHEILN